MIAAPTIAIDLPLKALIWEDEEGKVWVSYNTAEYVMRRHGIPDGSSTSAASPRCYRS